MYTDTLSGKFSGPLTGNASSATAAKWLMNRGATTGTNAVTVADSTWNPGQVPSGHTAREIVWKQRWTEAGLTYTPSNGTASNNNDTADLRLWLSSSNTSNILQVNMDIDGQIYAMGGFKGNLNGNANTASHLTTTDISTTNTNLDDLKDTNLTTYFAGGSNNVVAASNPGGSGAAFGLIVSRIASGYRLQDLTTSGGIRYFRVWNNSAWGSWYKLLDSSNTYAANSNGTAVTVTCGTAATLATINNVAIKINVTKPSYNWSDIGSKPDLNKLSIVKNNAATFYLMGTTTTVSDTATDITAVASTAMTYNGADKGTAKITLGTATATSSTGGHYGELFLYSTGTNGTSIKAAANSTAAYVATLQAATGTIAYTADITTAIQALDVAEKTNTASKTIDKISETDGKISVTFKDISITKSQVSDFPTTMTPASHSHGNITNTGTIGTAGKKKLVIVGTDNKVTTGAEIGSTTTTFLNNAGNWGTPANNAVTHTLKNTAKFYVTGTESATGSTGGDTFDDGVYVTATSGQLNATSYLVATHVMLTYNTTDQSLDFSFV